MRKKSTKVFLVLMCSAICSAACGGADSEDDDSGVPTDADTTTGTDSGLSEEGISDVEAAVHPTVRTILVVTWKQNAASDNVWLKYIFENGEYFESPKRPGTVGEHREVILGVPSEKEVTFYIVQESGQNQVDGPAYAGTTGSLPPDMPRPTFLEHNPSIASSDRWNLGSVEDTQDDGYYVGPFWIYIVDRQARIVWYYKDPMDSKILFPMVSADGTHIIFNTFNIYDDPFANLHRATLDFEYREDMEMAGMDWAYAEMPDGRIIYSAENVEGGKNANRYSENGNFGYSILLMERQTDGTTRQIWDSTTWAEGLGMEDDCFSNTVNWDPERDTVLVSMPFINTVLEIDRESGDLISQWGDAPGSWAFSPTTAGLEFNHYPTITKDGTLLVSSHIPGGDDPGDHRIMEFEIDDENKILEEKWVYGEGIQDWAWYAGEAQRMENGNTLINYGTGGSVREVTPDKKTAWHILWEGGFDSEKVYNKLCGHNVFIDDLYALNRGPGD